MKWLLLGWLVLALVACNLVVPGHSGPTHWCVPAHSWRCNPQVKWSDM
jgi:hypothetical protein